MTAMELRPAFSTAAHPLLIRWFRNAVELDCLLARSGDRPFQGIAFYGALDFREKAELPLGPEVAGFLGKPDI